MNCSEFRTWLEDAEASRDARAGSSHVDHCGDAACRSLWEEFVLVEDAIAAWKKDVPSTALVDRVWREIERPAPVTVLAPRTVTIESETQSIRTRGWIVLALSVTAFAVATWGLTNLNKPGPNVPSGSGLAQQPEVEPAQAEPPLQRYSVASVNLAQNASAFVADAALLTVHDVGDPDDPSRPVSAWATRVSRQLQPLGENINQAIEYIDEVIPDMPVMQMMPTS